MILEVSINKQLVAYFYILTKRVDYLSTSVFAFTYIFPKGSSSYRNREKEKEKNGIMKNEILRVLDEVEDGVQYSKVVQLRNL